MKFLRRPASDPHTCDRDLWSLGDCTIGTVVVCDCGRRWECIRASFVAFLSFRALHPVGHNRLKLWRSAGYERSRGDA